MHRQLTTALAVLLLATGAIVTAAPAADEPTDEARPRELVADYNEHVGQHPWFVEEYVSGEHVELVLHDADGDTSYYHGTVALDGSPTTRRNVRTTRPFR